MTEESILEDFSSEEIVVGDTIYYLLNPDGSIGSFARWKLDAAAIEASEPIVQGHDGKYYFESQLPEIPAPDYKELRRIEYPDFREYLDAQVKINSGNDELIAAGNAQLEAYYAACLTVKAKYPKENIDEEIDSPNDSVSDV